MVAVVDNAGATASATTTVTVHTPADALTTLIAFVQGLPLQPVFKNILLRRLQAALTFMNRGLLLPACNQLGVFAQLVEILLLIDRLDPETADLMISTAQAIEVALGCP